MNARLLLVALVSWIVGVLCGLGYVAFSGGYYEYHVISSAEMGNGGGERLINVEGWQIPPERLPDGSVDYLRRPRFRLP